MKLCVGHCIGWFSLRAKRNFAFIFFIDNNNLTHFFIICNDSPLLYCYIRTAKNVKPKSISTNKIRKLWKLANVVWGGLFYASYREHVKQQRNNSFLMLWVLCRFYCFSIYIIFQRWWPFAIARCYIGRHVCLRCVKCCYNDGKVERKKKQLDEKNVKFLRDNKILNRNIINITQMPS